MARTRPNSWPASRMSPTFRQPCLTSTVATAPRPFSRLDSTTTPAAGPSGTAFSSSTSACSSKRFEQRVDALAGLRRDVDEDRVAAPVLRDHLVLGEFVPDPVRIGVGLVDLVDRDDHRHAGRLGMLDRFDGLRHDAVVGRHHQDHDVGDLGAARTHRGERRVARRIEEGDLALVGFDHDRRRCAG